jgi:hypothetical protein
MRGCSNSIPSSADPSVPASGPTGSNGWTWDPGVSYGGWYAGHELGHTLGRSHAGPVAGRNPNNAEVGPCAYNQTSGSPYYLCNALPCSMTEGPDHNYPYPASQLVGPSQADVGYDEGDATNNLNLAALAMPSPKWHDIMSYCDYEWLSDYTYRAVMDRLRAEEALPPPPPPPPPPPAAAASSSPGAAGAPSPSGTSRPAGTPLLIGTPSDPPSYVGGDFITIVGTADITQRTGAIRFVHRVQQAKVRPADRASPVRLRLIDRAGRTIEEVPVPFLPSTDRRPGEDVRGVVDAVIPANAELKAVELLVAGNVAARYEAPETAHLQSTEIRTSVTRTPAQAVPAGAGRRLQLEWGPPRAAAAVAPGEIRYDVQASRDGGRTWEVLANGVPNPSADVDLSGFANVREIELRVIANEGFESREIARRKVER